MTTTTTTTSVRNALGDIGNKLTSNSIIAASSMVVNGALKNKDNFLNLNGNLRNENADRKKLIDNKMDVCINAAQVMSITEEDIKDSVDEKNIEEKIEVTDISLEEIIDIDEPDASNPQLVSEYVKDIYEYLSEMEVLSLKDYLSFY
jgi:hypothetical protein